MKKDSTTILIKKLYEILGPQLGSHLVDPNVVLTISGVRGRAEYVCSHTQPDDWERLESLNNITETMGIKFVRSCQFIEGSMSVTLENLKGFEKTSRQSRLPFVTPFSSASGWKALREWLMMLYENAAKEFGRNDADPFDPCAHMVLGITYGYPDRALIDFLQWLKSHRKHHMASSKIPYSDRYECSQPNFTYLPGHEMEPSIQKTIRQWGKILKDFYMSPWHLTIEKDRDFLEARRLDDEMLKDRIWKSIEQEEPAITGHIEVFHA